MRHKANRRNQGVWSILVAAGFWLILAMGLVLIALSIGFALGSGLIAL